MSVFVTCSDCLQTFPSALLAGCAKCKKPANTGSSASDIKLDSPYPTYRDLQVQVRGLTKGLTRLEDKIANLKRQLGESHTTIRKRKAQNAMDSKQINELLADYHEAYNMVMLSANEWAGRTICSILSLDEFKHQWLIDRGYIIDEKKL